MTTDRLKKAAAAILSLLILCPQAAVAPAWADSGASVDAISVAKDTVRISLSSPVAYRSFVTATPARLVIELPGTQYQVDRKSFPGRGDYLKDVRAGQFQRSPQLIARVVLDLKKQTAYQVAQDGTDLVVTLGAPAAQSAAAPAPAPAQAAADAAALQAAGQSGQASEAAPASDASAQAAKAEKEDGLDPNYSPELAAIARSADATATGKKAQAASAAPAAVVEAAPEQVDMLARLPVDPVTLDFDNTDIRDVIRLMAAKARMNIIYGPDVTGNLTLHLTNVPFNEAFGTILTMMNLTTTQVGDDVLRVLTPAAAQSAKSAAATATKVIPLNYAKAADLAAAVNQIRSAEGRPGTTIADAKTNSLIVTESPEGLISTEKIVNELDVRPKQVLIEVKLIEVGLTNSLNYGIQWDLTGVNNGRIGGQSGTNYIGNTVGPMAGATTLTSPLNTTANTIPVPLLGGSGVGGNGRGTGVNLPASNILGALTFGRITNNYFLNATLTAAAAEGKVKVLSDPKVATLNNQPATINVTTQIPYVTANVASTGVQTQTLNYAITGIQLTVTPTINADGRITLMLNPNVSQPSATSSAATAVTGAPGIDSRNATTTVMVDNGETIVIGGLISDSVSDQYAKIPLLGDIPIIGWLFKKKDHTRTRSELLIFVTSKIMAA